MKYPLRWSLSISLSCFVATSALALSLWFGGPVDNEGGAAIMAVYLGITAAVELVIGMALVGPLSYAFVKNARKSIRAVVWVLSSIATLGIAYLLIFLIIPAIFE